jgi:hypothetical protein
MIPRYLMGETGRQLSPLAYCTYPANRCKLPQKSEGPTPQSMRITTTILPQVSETAMGRPVNEEGMV